MKLSHQFGLGRILPVIGSFGVIVGLECALAADEPPRNQTLVKSADPKVTASFAVDPSKRLENLLDGDPATVVIGQPNSAVAGKPVWIDLKFKEPLTDLAGLKTGVSDPFKNYYPIDVQFWGDSDGNGTFDTLLGSATLGPGTEAAGDRKFAGRLEKTFGVRFLVMKQNVAGLNRAFQLSDLDLIRDATAPLIKATPDRTPPVAHENAAKPAEPAANPGPKRVALDQSIVPDSAALPGKVMPLPPGTTIRSSHGTDKDKGADKLFDGDLSTVMNGVPNSANGPASVFLRFPEPVSGIGGIETGESDPFANYFPIQMEFWADSNGDTRCDTLLGTSRKFGPGKQAIGRHLFESKLEKIYALEIRATEQKQQGARRAYQMNEMRLIAYDDLPLATPTPDSYRVLYYTSAIPSGTTATVTVDTEEGKGANALLDNDPNTFMNPKSGTAQAGRPVSVFVRFPSVVTDLAGIVLGRSDPFNNYVWHQMEVYADTTGSGTYDTLASTFSSGVGERRFSKVLPKAFGLELRVTSQSLKGTMRAFMLSGVEGLVYREKPGTNEMRFVAEDFEDFSSWRTWANNTAQPEGERYYGGHTYLSGAFRPQLAKDGNGVGLMRYCFKEGKGNAMWAKRGRVSKIEGLIEAVEFWANPQDYPCTVSFEFVDAAGKKMRTNAAALSGNTWAKHRVELNAKTVPNLAEMTYPFTLLHVWMHSANGGTGDVLLDDITYVGVFDRTKRVSIKPVFEGMAYDPEKPLVVKYRLRNATGDQLSGPVDVKLYSSLDPHRKAPLVTRTVTADMSPYGSTEVSVDMGQVPYGHYFATVTFSGEGFVAQASDEVAVLKLNGGRINKSPMWFGSQHSMGWLSHVENEFVLDNVVIPLGLDAYRCGMPDQDNKILLNTNLLLAAGFGGMPPHLRLPNQKNEHRGEPNDYDAYLEFVQKQAREKYMPYADRILSVEFYNEPDLPGFEYFPEIDTYLKMHRVFAKGFRETIPGIKIGTGGNTVQHGKEKKDFNPRMYTELAKEADVAIFHAHGALDNFISRQRMVEGWLEKGGRPRDTMVIGNSEAGLPSGATDVGQLEQADNLIKKIGWAKSQTNSLFYVWFTTTDTYDPQGGYLDNENWGLVTYNQRLKPSGQAYNELVRKLANTRGNGEVNLDSRLQACSYTREDGTQVWLVWPRDKGTALLMRFAASAPVTVTDMFGAATTVTPEAGLITLAGNGYPFYVEAAPDVKFGQADKPAFASYKEVVGVAPGQELVLPVAIKNVWDADAEITLEMKSNSGVSMASFSGKIARGATGELTLRYKMPADVKFGSIGCGLRITGTPNAAADQTLPLTLVVAEPVVKAASFEIDGKPDSIPGSSAIVLDKDLAVQELAFDPNTPVWAGANDLSVRATLAHDGKGLYVCFDVTDQTHNPGPASDKLWHNDSVQLAFYAGNAHTEIGMTERDGGFGWSWISSNTDKVNQKLDTPVAVKREGGKTIYEAYLPFESLGVKYVPGMPLRFTFLINEDDGRGRVRIMKWFDGIAAGKDSDRFGHVVLE